MIFKYHVLQYGLRILKKSSTIICLSAVVMANYRANKGENLFEKFLDILKSKEIFLLYTIHNLTHQFCGSLLSFIFLTFLM